MSRRTFLKSLAAFACGVAFPAAAHAVSQGKTWKTLQTSPLAGFQYHYGEYLWPKLVTGQQLTLVREAANRFDDRAVRIDWQCHKIGYLPRTDNAAVSQLLDRGETLEAVIVGLESSSNPWNRVRVEVRWRV